MKKVICSMIIVLCCVCALGIQAGYAQGRTLEQAWEEMHLRNYPEAMEKVNEEFQKAIERWCESEKTGNFIYYKMHYGDGAEEICEGVCELYRKEAQPDLEKGFQLYHLRGELITDLSQIRYALQYAKNRQFDYILNQPYWCVPCVEPTYSYRFLDMTPKMGFLYFRKNKEMEDFLKDIPSIEKKLEEAGAEGFQDCKLVTANNEDTLLYLKYSNQDYAIQLTGSKYQLAVTGLELFKVYPLTEVLEKIGKLGETSEGIPEMARMLDTKPTYEAEAESLQADGLLQGNENGLDLLKPLTRIEATTMLVRALGLEGEINPEQPSVFSDLPQNHWGTPYAMCAYEQGLTKGVSETEFAPEKRISSNEFGTLLLRSAGEDIDWTQATQMLIDRGILTEEQAETMDLFTRGDMAKILYEAKQQGLL